MRTLRTPQIVGDLGFEFGVDGFGEIMTQQHVFGRDRAVGFQLEHPMPVGLPIAEQRLRRGGDAVLQRRGIYGFGLIDGRHFGQTPLYSRPVLRETGHGVCKIRRAPWRAPDRRRGHPTAPSPRWLPATPYQSSRRRETGF